MTLIERYKKGETIEVYQEIYLLGEKAFEKNVFAEIEPVLIETFQRVKYNLEILYAALTERKYQFKTLYECTSDYPIAKPLKNCDKLLIKLDKTVQKFGYVPLSLKMFFKIVGSCNFGWDYDTEPNLIWEYADPIQIAALDDILSLMKAEDWKEMMKELVEDGIDEDNCPYIEFSADYYHKDNVSGDQGYAIELTPRPSIDSRVLFEEHKTTFIHYLRLYFQKGGFIRIDNPDNEHDFADYLELVLPKLLKI
jgi:hypothetical protein